MRAFDEYCDVRATLGAARDTLVLAVGDLDEVAFLLGFEDANSFLRAFRLWEGQTPTRWRATHPPIKTRAGRVPARRGR